MSRDEIAVVLAKCAAYDGREPSKIAVDAWLEALGDLPLGAALEAVAKHYAVESRWAMPADIRKLARRAVERAEGSRRRGDDAARIARCSMCDERGYRGNAVCRHNPAAVDAGRRSRAKRLSKPLELPGGH